MTSQDSGYYLYQPSSENAENVGAQIGGRRGKTGILSATGTVGLTKNQPVIAGPRTVLSTVTNRQLIPAPAPPVNKPTNRNEFNNKDLCIQATLLRSRLVPKSQQQNSRSAAIIAASNVGQQQRQPVDLSCHEMDDMSLDLAQVATTSGSHFTFQQFDDSSNINDEMNESHDSVKLLDMSSSCEEEDAEAEIGENKEDDNEEAQKERIDRLMSMVEYREEIYEYLRRAELARRPRPNYMQRQTDIKSNMRTILVDWLVEVAEEYHLNNETLFLSVDYVDRFLSSMAVQRSKLQLVGTTAMFIASKYEEIYPPDITDFVYVTDNTYTNEQVLRMEHLLLKVLAFDVAMPTVHTFCNRFLKEMHADERTVVLSMYLIELSLLDDLFIRYVPSITAAAAICLANITLGVADPWPTTYVELTQYKIADFALCLTNLFNFYSNIATMPQQAVCRKYKRARYLHVSKIEPPKSLPALVNW